MVVFFFGVLLSTDLNGFQWVSIAFLLNEVMIGQTIIQFHINIDEDWRNL